MAVIITGKLILQAVFLNRIKYDVDITEYYYLYTIQEFYFFHETIPRIVQAQLH